MLGGGVPAVGGRTARLVRLAAGSRRVSWPERQVWLLTQTRGAIYHRRGVPAPGGRVFVCGGVALSAAAPPARTLGPRSALWTQVSATQGRSPTARPAPAQATAAETNE